MGAAQVAVRGSHLFAGIAFLKESPIFSRTYDLVRWLVPATVKFPRQHRFVLASALQRTGFAFQERLIEAVLGAETAASLRDADVALAKLRFYLRLSRDLGLLTDRQYAHVSAMVVEIGRLLGAWRKSRPTR